LNFIITQGNEEKSYEQMIEETRTLTSEFFKIILERNEFAQQR